MKPILFILLSLLFAKHGLSQSFELMSMSEKVFTDAQYLSFFDQRNSISLFSRVRATAEYDQSNTDLFTGAYLNYTSGTGIGGTVLGRISSFSSGIDVGIHYFKAKKKFMVYALPSVNIGGKLLYSWFSIVRFTPTIQKDWKLYSSLELFSAFDSDGHISSVQRIRLGVDRKGYQFGFALNLAENRYESDAAQADPGLFIRKQF